jgi:hypothetical protein
VFSGNEKGSITIFEDIENNIYSQFKKISTHYGNVNEGSSVSLSLADIDNDGILDMAMGNSRGGISIYSTDYRLDGTKVVTADPDHLNFKLFPNPIHDYFVIQSTEDVQLDLSISSISGNLLIHKKVITNSRLDFDELSAGLYIVQYKYKDKNFIQKLIKR